MKLPEQRFLKGNWGEFVHYKVLKKLLYRVPQFHLGDWKHNGTEHDSIDWVNFDKVGNQVVIGYSDKCCNDHTATFKFTGDPGGNGPTIGLDYTNKQAVDGSIDEGDWALMTTDYTRYDSRGQSIDVYGRRNDPNHPDEDENLNYKYLNTALFHTSKDGSLNLPILVNGTKDVLQPDAHPELTDAYVPTENVPDWPEACDDDSIAEQTGNQISYNEWVWDKDTSQFLRTNLMCWPSVQGINQYVNEIERQIGRINAATFNADETDSLTPDFSKTQWDGCHHIVEFFANVNLSDGQYTNHFNDPDPEGETTCKNAIQIWPAGHIDAVTGKKSTKPGLFAPDYMPVINGINSNVENNIKNINIINNTTISEELPNPQNFDASLWGPTSNSGLTQSSIWYVNNAMLVINISAAWLKPWTKGGKLDIDMTGWQDSQGNKITDRVRFVPATGLVSCTASGKMSDAGNMSLVNMDVSNGHLTATANDTYDLPIDTSVSKGVAINSTIQIILNPLHQKLVN